MTPKVTELLTAAIALYSTRGKLTHLSPKRKQGMLWNPLLALRAQNVSFLSASSISPGEREELADCLWASLDPAVEFAATTEDEWVAELNRRSAELKADPRHGVAWDEVRNMR